MTTFAHEAAPYRPINRADLRDPIGVAHEILDLAMPLCDDEAYQTQFYDELGVVRTELKPGADVAGSAVWYKDDTVQDSGSYKRRGATSAAMNSTGDTLACYSTGNHGLAVAYVGARLGKHVKIALTEDISPAKQERLKQTEAELAYFGNFTAAQKAVESWESNPDVTVVRPFGQKDVLAGQCSFGFEVVGDMLRLGLTGEDETVVIPVSAAGGGHIFGVAAPIWRAKMRGVLGPNVHVVGVQPERTDALGRAVRKVRAGKDPQNLFANDWLDKDCDALAISEENLSALTLALAADRRFVDSFHTVGKLTLARARRDLSDQLRKEVEPAAALPMAYALANARAGTTFVLPVSGGNISVETRKLYDGLTVADNIVKFRELSASSVDGGGYRRAKGYSAISIKRANHIGASPVTRRFVPSAAERRKEMRGPR